MGERKAIIFSTHILEEVEAVCSRAIIIDRGQIVANGTPQQLNAKSDMAGTVVLVARGVAGNGVVERMTGVANVRKTSIIKEEKGKVWARIYPREASLNGDLARNVLAAASGWQVEEVHTEEGRLDEVFRAITLPETAKETTK
jgi:ABC-2 type transport system ATP-binding protein